MKLKTVVLAATLAVAPFAANAFSVGAGSNLSNGGNYNINSGPFFWDATFTAADGPGSVSFSFANSGGTGQTVGVTQGTVLQFSGQFNGLTVAWGNGTSQSVAAGQNAIINVSSFLANNAVDMLTISWGNVTGVKANIDIDVAAVPVPAGILLLGTALVGMGALTRRKAA